MNKQLKLIHRIFTFHRFNLMVFGTYCCVRFFLLVDYYMKTFCAFLGIWTHTRSMLTYSTMRLSRKLLPSSEKIIQLKLINRYVSYQWYKTLLKTYKRIILYANFLKENHLIRTYRQVFPWLVVILSFW